MFILRVQFLNVTMYCKTSGYLNLLKKQSIQFDIIYLSFLERK